MVKLLNLSKHSQDVSRITNEFEYTRIIEMTYWKLMQERVRENR